ncbi:hypothetical protein [Streptomyces sp. KS 21]|uniref:hypothetical protein n=1 Tax=Streptomyces sp. KS 21 TaxID=2485150 RepID=UPI001062C984|nr:hypothetical protein [Streptomyces sp. KS 21]
MEQFLVRQRTGIPFQVDDLPGDGLGAGGRSRLPPRNDSLPPMRRGHLTNGQWERLEPLLPVGKKPDLTWKRIFEQLQAEADTKGLAWKAVGLLILPDTHSFHGIPITLAMVTAKIE